LAQPKLSAQSFEQLFDGFVEGFENGRRLDKYLSENIIAGKKCADYFFPDQGKIIELKTLNENHASIERIVQLVDSELARKKYPAALRDQWLLGHGRLPKPVAQKVNDRVQSSLKKVVRKANEQIESTRLIMGEHHDAILVVANLNEFLFGPMELLKYLAGHALRRSTTAIDGILLITPGVKYAVNAGVAQHYVVPVYKDGKQYLGDFVEPLAEAWIDYESKQFGLTSEVEKVFDIDEISKSARPIE
jgi:hypothetical protein